jgi:phosphoribosylformimino-5-aminoimidazole carboxamide ribotide isomerase|tara:strand:+ start:905 stop:1630 length:726 start_codon:yes stop_codon:yes gene_type:complete
MIFLPAIDICEGACVRLERGDFNKKTVFNKSPLNQAMSFESLGCDWLHVVDLDGARDGNSNNYEFIKEITSQTNLKIQFGGGVRSFEKIKKLLDLGVERVILGTKALKNIEFLEAASDLFPRNIAVGIDARKGKVSTDGWTKDSNIDAEEFALRAASKGACAIIFTDIDKDGVMSGPNNLSTKTIAEKVSIPVIASGGISNINDVIEIKKIESSGVAGMICGRAIYDGKIDIKEALEVVRG